MSCQLLLLYSLCYTVGLNLKLKNKDGISESYWYDAGLSRMALSNEFNKNLYITVVRNEKNDENNISMLYI